MIIYKQSALLFKILKIEGGVDVLDTKPFGLAYAYDKFKEKLPFCGSFFDVKNQTAD